LRGAEPGSGPEIGSDFQKLSRQGYDTHPALLRVLQSSRNFWEIVGHPVPQRTLARGRACRGPNKLHLVRVCLLPTQRGCGIQYCGMDEKG
jgi:hypothetical protein